MLGVLVVLTIHDAPVLVARGRSPDAGHAHRLPLAADHPQNLLDQQPALLPPVRLHCELAWQGYLGGMSGMAT